MIERIIIKGEKNSLKARSTWVSKDRFEQASISIGQFRNVYLASTSFRRSSSTSLPFLSIRADELDRTLGTSKLLGTEAEGYKTKEMALRFRDE